MSDHYIVVFDDRLVASDNDKEEALEAAKAFATKDRPAYVYRFIAEVAMQVKYLIRNRGEEEFREDKDNG